ncbi:MAG: TonB-dependent receptor [Pseudomonadota bacterium]
MPVRQVFSTVSVVAMAAALATNAAHAQVDEIVVTAQKREQSLQDVPVSVTVFDAEALADYQIEGIQDYFAFTPNVGIVQTNPTSTDISIRGVSNIGGAANSLGVYVDEFNINPAASVTFQSQSGLRTFDQNLFDLERLEVLRGPQGTYFGRNVIGGAINVTTQKPDDELAFTAEAEYGRFDSYLLRAIANTPIVEGKAAARFSAVYRESDGFIEDLGPANNSDAYEQAGVRGAFRFTPTEQLTVDASVSYSDYQQGIEAGVPTGIFFGDIALLGTFGGPVDPGAGFYPDNQEFISTDRPFEINNETLIATVRAEYDLGAFSVVSVSGYIDNDYDSGGDTDGTSNDWYFSDDNDQFESWSTELRVQSNEGSAFDWVFGVLYAEDDTDGFTSVNLTQEFVNNNSVIPFLIGGPLQGPTLAVTNQTVAAERESFGVFGDVTGYFFDDRLQASIGGRFSYDEVFTSLDAQDISTGFAPVSSSGDASFSDFSPRFAAVYEVSDRVNLYTNISRGYKPGNFNLNTEAILNAGLPVSDTVEDESAWNYEVGLKGVFFNGALLANLSAFRLDWSDLQVSQEFTEGLNIIQFTSNAASATSQGVEIDLVARPLDGLEINANAGYLDATFDDFPNAVSNQGSGEFDASGQTLPLAPEWSASGAVTYTKPIRTNLEGFVRGEISYRGEQFATAENLSTVTESLPSFVAVNFRGGLETEHWRVVGFVENAFEEEYYIGTAGANENAASGVHVIPAPRRFGVRVTYKY